MNKYGLVGKSIQYSFSPKYFASKFEKENLNNFSYELFDLENLTNIKSLMIEKDIKGFNVTTPYKTDIIPFLDELDETAKAIEAVNCVKIENEKFIGYNTDAFGFGQMIKPFLEQKHERAFILGKGGASQAIAYVLENLGIQCFFVRREAELPNELEYNQLNDFMLNQIQVIVNCTPIGTFPNVNERPDLPYKGINENHFLIDLVYNPKESAFLKAGKENGAMILNGYDMLVWQAEKSWDIWLDK